MRKPVTTDIGVLQGWPLPKKGPTKPVASAAIATALGITVFQITARLKGMEGRGFVMRDKAGLWLRTPQGESEAKNPSPSVSGVGKKQRMLDSTGNNSGPPDDSKLPVLKLKKGEWCSTDTALKHAQNELPVVTARLAEMQKDPRRYKREMMALQVEIDNYTAIIKKKRKGCWSSRYVHEKVPFTVFIAPDQREYVHARPWETADLLIEGTVTSDPIRLRLYSTSNLNKKQQAAAKEKDARAAAAKEKAQAERNARILEDEANAKEERSRKAKPAVKAPARQEAHSRSAKKAAGGRGKEEGRKRVVSEANGQSHSTEKAEREAEHAFWSLSKKERDAIRKTGKYDSYESWYKTRPEARRPAAKHVQGTNGKARSGVPAARNGARPAARGRKEEARAGAHPRRPSAGKHKGRR